MHHSERILEGIEMGDKVKSKAYGKGEVISFNNHLIGIDFEACSEIRYVYYTGRGKGFRVQKDLT